MSYVLQCVIAPARALVPCRAYVNAVVADLGRGLGLMPMTPGLFDEVRGGDNGDPQFAVEKAGLPPIRLHDLRHCAATFLKASGSDLNDIKEMLGHSTITITSDTYTSVIHEPETERAKAEAAAALVPRVIRRAG